MQFQDHLVTGSTERPVIAVLRTRQPTHGLNRYASVLAAGLREAGSEVVVVDLPDDDPWRAFGAARRARRADVVQLQFTDRYLGSEIRQLVTTLAVRLALLGRPLVVTAHDFHTPRPEILAARRARGRASLRLGVRRRLVDLVADASARVLLGSAATVLTCSPGEQQLVGWTRPRRTSVVPHYVEPPTEAVEVGVDEHKIVVAGFIHRRKGQHVAVEALPWLPEHHLVLAGSATGRNLGYLAELRGRADDLGVGDRLRVTGYLDDAEMTRELRSARLALAPYQRIAASGSIATLIGSGVPLVARASAYTEELARQCPRAIHLFAGDEPADLARAVAAAAAEPLDAQRAELAELARRLSPRAVAERHLEVYGAVLSADPTAGVDR